MSQQSIPNRVLRILSPSDIPVLGNIVEGVGNLVSRFGEAIGESFLYGGKGLYKIGERGAAVVIDGTEYLVDELEEVGKDLISGPGGGMALYFGAGALILFGPGVALLVIAATEVAGKLLVESRHPSDEEMAFLARVFGTTLPPAKKIILTDLASKGGEMALGGRAFVVPNAAGEYLVNLGAAYANPMAYTSDRYATPGKLFVHEMTHVWQDWHSSNAAATLLDQATDDDYNPGTEVRRWSQYSPEEQATVVDEWFAPQQLHPGTPGCSSQHPFYPMIRDILQQGDAPLETSNGKVVYGAIGAKYRTLDAEIGLLGLPTTNEYSLRDGKGRRQDFEKGSILWHPKTGAHVLQGRMLRKWEEMGGHAFGYPTCDATGTPSNSGIFAQFRNPAKGTHGAIYARSGGTIHAIYGGILKKWAEMGWESSPLGWPVGDERDGARSKVRLQSFEGGTIAWHPATHAAALWGSLDQGWKARGMDQFAVPTTDSTPTPNGVGMFSHMIRDPNRRIPETTSLYQNRSGEVIEISGTIRLAWKDLEWEKGRAGFPVAAQREFGTSKILAQEFENGFLVAHHTLHNHFLSKGMFAAWESLGGHEWGYPVASEASTPCGKGSFVHFRDYTDGTIAANIPLGAVRSIYRTPTHGHLPVSGAFHRFWRTHNWEKGSLGFPSSAESPLGSTAGVLQRFDGGILVWDATRKLRVLIGAIATKWSELGETEWGYPVCGNTSTPDGSAQFAHFVVDPKRTSEERSIYWKTRSEACAVRGAFRELWKNQGWERGSLGYPLVDESPAPLLPSAQIQVFEGGCLVWHAEWGAHQLDHDMYMAWRAAGSESFGIPFMDATPTPNQEGKFQHLRDLDTPSFPEVSLYWSPGTGASAIHGAIREFWAAEGWENGPLGFPIGLSSPLAEGGRTQRFQNGVLVEDARGKVTRTA
ncbi:MAG: hypothetical protein H6686_12060 [Fibrobacteria bacterium]|nr:hypothetical protein [Fibrobacteria bacterium]